MVPYADFNRVTSFPFVYSSQNVELLRLGAPNPILRYHQLATVLLNLVFMSHFVPSAVPRRVLQKGVAVVDHQSPGDQVTSRIECYESPSSSVVYKPL